MEEARSEPPAPAPPAKPYPGFIQSLGLLALVALASLVFSIPAVIVGQLAGTPDHPLLLGMVNLLAFGVVVAWGAWRAGTRLGTTFPLSLPALAPMLALTIAVAGLGIVLSELDNLFRSVAPMPEAFARAFEELVFGSTSLWGSLFVAVLVAPLTEELLFRGLILRGFLGRYSTGGAILLSSLLFGLFHLNPWQFLGATVLGALFAWLFVETGSLLPCLYAHALNNGLAILYARSEMPGMSGSLGEVTFQPWWLDVTGAALAILGLAWLHLSLRASPPATPAARNVPFIPTVRLTRKAPSADRD